MSAIIDFYTGTGTDGAGRSIMDVWTFDMTQLEEVHDYIQWLFPLAEASQFNPDAPLMTADDAAHIRDVFVLYSYKQMLAFYGLREVYFTGGSLVTKVELEDFGDPEGLEHFERMAGPDALATLLGPQVKQTFEERKKVWLTPGNHNFLRITRILKSLNLFGLGDKADEFMDALEELYQEHDDIIGEKTYNFWVSASEEN